MNDALTFLSVVSTPEGSGPEDLAAALAEASGLDAYLLTLKLRQIVPGILGRYPVGPAAAALDELHRLGGDGFLASMNDIEALGGTLKIRELSLDPNGLRAELWRGAPVIIDPRTIDVVVRGRASETQGSAASAEARMNEAVMNNMHFGLFGFHMAEGTLWAGMQQARENALHMAAMDQKVVEQHVLDLHVRDRFGARVYQIDGDKFGYTILGDQRGYSDNVNIDRMCELIVHLNNTVIVDPYFRMFRPPSGSNLLRLPMQNLNQDKPEFAFYSRWTALVYRHVMGA